MKKNRAVFLDRDGTFIKESHYLDSVKKIKIPARNIHALKLIKDAGYKAIIATNQSGVARGYFTEEFVKKAYIHINKMLKKHGLKLDGMYYCPHHAIKASINKYKKDCPCRKPKAGMLRKAAKKFSLQLSSCWSVGDKLADIDMGKRVKAGTILVLTGYGKKEKREIRKTGIKPDHIADNLLEAAKIIRAKGEKQKAEKT